MTKVCVGGITTKPGGKEAWQHLIFSGKLAANGLGGFNPVGVEAKFMPLCHLCSVGSAQPEDGKGQVTASQTRGNQLPVLGEARMPTGPGTGQAGVPA